MRRNRLTIGSAKDSPTHQFKNLKNVTIDFDQEHWVTVVIGWNGTGKSNVIEALAIIFHDLITYKGMSAERRKDIPRFAFKLSYFMGAGEDLRHIHIDADPDREKEAFLLHVADSKRVEQAELTHSLLSFGNDPDKSPKGEPTKLTAFLNADTEYLSRYVFSYYLGESPRLYEIFRPYLDSFDSKLRNCEDLGKSGCSMPCRCTIEIHHLHYESTCKRRHAAAVQLMADVDEGKRLFELATQDPDRAAEFKTVAGRVRRAIDRESPYSGDMHFLLRGQRSDAHPWI